MRIDSEAVRRLRNEHGWSQEQLAAAAGLSLRTVQRVETEGFSSRETRMCLAAAFDVDFGVLGNEPTVAAMPAAIAANIITPGRYKVAAGVSALALGVSMAGWVMLDGVRPWITATIMLAIATALYAGFGWYFQGAIAGSTPARRTAQCGFIYLAVLAVFSALSDSGTTYLLMGAQMALIFCGTYYAFDYYFTRKASLTR